jgi:uncharacterized damage-inducible protein DinB
MMNNFEIKQKVEVFGNAYYELAEALRQFPREMWGWKPAQNQWSIQEIMAHLTDGEANVYIRFRKGIAESGASITAYDQEAWDKCLGYENQDCEVALELYERLRAATYRLLNNQTDSTWKNTILHPERGVLTLESLLDSVISHDQRHLSQMKRVYEAWQRQSAKV